MSQNPVLVIGASSAIAKAVIDRLLQQGQTNITAVSRQMCSDYADNKHIEWISSDYSDSSIQHCCQQFNDKNIQWRHVIMCNGVLQTPTIQPEKRLEAATSQALHSLFESNAVIPLLWLQQLLPSLKQSKKCCVAILSARVGSIGDNASGGWYGYRASKAALNMLLKTAAIELSRRAKGVKLIAYHPGTVDTPLSKPFQKRIKEGNLFTPEFTAKQLLSIMQNIQHDGELSYLDWDNKPIQW